MSFNYDPQKNSFESTGPLLISQIFLDDGDVINPSLAFINDTDTGIYRPSNNTLGITAGGVEELEITSNQILAKNYAFLGETNSGFFKPGSGQLQLRTFGFTRLEIIGNQIIFPNVNNPLIPAMTFQFESDKGFYSSAANQISIAIGGTERVRFLNDKTMFASGNTANPSVSFLTNTTTGFFSAITNEIGISCGAFQCAKFDVSGIKLWGSTAASPSMSFLTDTDTGIYRVSADVLGFSCGGSTSVEISSSQLNAPNLEFIASEYAFGASPTSKLKFDPLDNELDIFHASILRMSIGTTETKNYNQWLNAVGTALLPAYSFINDPNCGIYSSAVDNIDFACAGVRVGNFSSTGIKTILGSVSSPAYSFIGDSNTGIYSSAADNIDFACGGSRIINVKSTGCQIVPGDAANPSYSFIGDNNTGMYNYGPNEVGFACGGLFRLRIGTLNCVTNLNILGTNGLVGAPAYSFSSDTDTGMYRSAADTIDFATAGTNRLKIDTAIRAQNNAQIVASNTGASIPGFTFSGDTDTGLYWNGPDSFGISQGGIIRWLWNTSFNFQPASDNTYDIGTSSVRIRDLYTARAQISGGSASAPSLCFNGDTNTGIFSSGADTLNLATAGSSVFLINTADLIVGSSCLNIQNGLATTPSLRFFNDSDTGLYLYGTNAIGFSTAGAWRMIIDPLGVYSSVPIQTSAGSASAPSFSFVNDTNTGFYNPAIDEIAVSIGGVRMYNFNVSAFYPWADNTRSCGANGFRWTAVWAATGTIQTSDINQKRDIEPCDLGLDFINRLQPKTYRWKPTERIESVYNEETKEYEEKKIKDTPVRKHYGLIAQDLKQVLDELNIDTRDFAGFIDTTYQDPDKPQSFGLIYTQFIAPMIKAIQELSQKINDLENIVNG